MCIAVFKPAGIKAPTMATLKQCFTKNPDGAGFMVALGDKVEIHKGFMTWDSFKKAYIDFTKGIDAKEHSIVYHFRISTQGGRKPELTHPFALTHSYDTMRLLKQECDMGIAHNGIISLTSDSSIKDRNDTMTFINEYLFDIIDNNPYWSRNPSKIRLVKTLTSGYPNRFAVLSKNGYCTLVGNWIKDGEIYYSNFSYRE